MQTGNVKALTLVAKRRAAIAASTVLGVVIVFWLALHLLRRGPEETAKTLAASISKGDWNGVFYLCSDREKELHGWNKSNFTAFASYLCGSLPKSWGEFRADDVTLYDYPPGAMPPFGIAPARHRRYSVYFEKGPREEGKLLKTSLAIRKGESGDWHPDLSPLLLYLNKLKGGTRIEKLDRLRGALMHAGLSRLVSFDFNKQVTLESLDRAIAGQSDPNDVTTLFFGR